MPKSIRIGVEIVENDRNARGKNMVVAFVANGWGGKKRRRKKAFLINCIDNKTPMENTANRNKHMKYSNSVHNTGAEYTIARKSSKVCNQFENK